MTNKPFHMTKYIDQVGDRPNGENLIHKKHSNKNTKIEIDKKNLFSLLILYFIHLFSLLYITTQLYFRRKLRDKDLALL